MPFKNDEIGFNKMRTIFFFGLIIILGIGIMYLFKPFFYPIFWAAIIAVMFYPTYSWLYKHLKLKSVSAILTLIIIIAIIIIPLVGISTLIINQSIILYQNVTESNIIIQIKGLASWLEHSQVAPYLEEFKTYWNNYAQNFAKIISTFLFNNLQNLTQNSLNFLGMFFLMLYSLFFFLKDGPGMLKRLMRLSPLGDKYEEMLYNRFTSTARATLKGTLLMGIIQGTLGGLLFWFTGIQGPLIWAVLMAATSIIPAVGTSIIWLPAGLIMLIIGNTWQGITILIFGMLVISTIDNLLRPKLVGKDTQMHQLLVLFSTLGGIVFFGISGVVIGPIIVALFLAIINIYECHYKDELEKN